MVARVLAAAGLYLVVAAAVASGAQVGRRLGASASLDAAAPGTSTDALSRKALLRSSSTIEGAGKLEARANATLKASIVGKSSRRNSTLNVTVPALAKSNSSENTSLSQPFVSVHANATNDEGVRNVEVHIASPNVIISIYILMFFPIALSWIAMKHYGRERQFYPIVLPLTLCAMICGADLANQSLAVVMGAPMAITLIQAVSMVVVTASWTVMGEARRPTLSSKMAWPLLKWTAVVGVLFAIFQLVNHMVSFLCSLPERVIFTNLTPPLALIIEMTLLPPAYVTEVSFAGKLALSMMAVGGLLFAMQYSDFTMGGTLAGFLMVGTVLPYRIGQRWLLMESKELPVAILACIDGLCMLLPSTVITVMNQDSFFNAWFHWFSVPSIAILLILSWVTTIGSHICTLLMLRTGSATNYLVFSNLSNFVIAVLGYAFFKDKGGSLVYIGIGISLFGGLWYSFEAQSGQEPKKSTADAETYAPGVAAEDVLLRSRSGFGDGRATTAP